MTPVPSEPRTQRSEVSGRPKKPLTPLRYVRGSDDTRTLLPQEHG